MVTTANRQQKLSPDKERAFVLWFEDVGMSDVSLVGGKNASLGEMIQQLTPKGINVPGGFATTAYAYRYFIEQAGIESQLRQLFADLDVEDLSNLRKRSHAEGLSRGKQARALILNTPFPEELQTAITEAYSQLCQRYSVDCESQEQWQYNYNVDVAVRSSATAEDLPDASFAGQQETYLNVHGVQSVLEACHKCFASLFTDRAISYRTARDFDERPTAPIGAKSHRLAKQAKSRLSDALRECAVDAGASAPSAERRKRPTQASELNSEVADLGTREFDHFDVALSVGVQKMVRSDLATSGVMFSIDTETGFKDAALITAAYGLGENVVQGAVNPDEYTVFKPTLTEGHHPILDKRLGSKEIKMVYDLGGSKLTKNVPTSVAERIRYAINDEEILQLAKWACQIESHYSQVRDAYTPMDIEWAKDGVTGELFIVQARPETVQSQKQENVCKTYRLDVRANRDSSLVAHLFDERNHAVKSMLQMAIPSVSFANAKAQQNNRKIGICGQAPSDYLEIAEFLVQQGINSISLNPDSVLKTRLKVAEVEQNIG